MPVTIGGLRERAPGETRVSLVPEIADKLAALGARVVLERGAGVSAQFPDALYKKVEWADSAEAVLAAALRAPQPPGPSSRGYACTCPGTRAQPLQLQASVVHSREVGRGFAANPPRPNCSRETIVV